ncbi:cysteine dioxygenase [Nocardioides jiangxiensis]|uniref:Cysteine dioxygenase family protein n=1 Tax=Nocardioides jiangxiensis TaxID=3064524 RepID=A0ABT9B3F1_9ACTN|nr:cysteine dioxygenase family protein [Nocardioides sp. WY-20]MDO7868768.1 cysteine dioxygenase family protein [Nocardioides sp. WY-20]
MTLPLPTSQQFRAAQARTAQGRPTRARLDHLVRVIEDNADRADLLELVPVLEPGATERAFVLVEETDEHQLWLITWPAGASTGWHDHGSAAGAFTVLEGRLVEQNWSGGLKLAQVTSNSIRVHGAGHVHDVQNRSGEQVVSLHAYGARLDAMNHYEFLGDRIRLISAETGR